MVSDAEEFCAMMGFDVGEHPYCYNGVPTASYNSLNIPLQKNPKYLNLTNKATIYWDPRHVVKLFTNNPPAIAQYLLSLVAVAFLVFTMYEIHQWQMGLREEQERLEQSYRAKQREKIGRLRKRRELMREFQKTKRELK
jgi:hypothetical protein